MQAGLRTAYTNAANDTGGIFAPVGDAWEATIAAYSAIDLHDSDGSHPSIYGSYLAACVFFTLLTGEDFTAVTYWPASISSIDAQTLMDMADQTVNF